MKSRLANFGCGSIYHSDWRNFDMRSIPGEVEQLDLTSQLSLPEKSFDFIYCSHSLEHLGYLHAVQLLTEFYRLLDAGGVCRIVVPCFESLCKEYLFRLEDCRRSGTQQARRNLEFITTLILDDLTKETNDGLKMPLLQQGYYDNQYVMSVSGFEPSSAQLANASRPSNSWRKIKSFMALPRKGAFLRDRLFAQSDPRANGYAHKWMWDPVQLSFILSDIGFSSIQEMTFNTSALKTWSHYGFDSKTDNSAESERHPLSLYLEASKDAS